ncbi:MULTISPECIES: hypothetical protein [Thermoactinomyces]|uniref:Uncharacterized protein n=1 Tax=Thermoactinomyces daqus TaxID=1329516 RepID=A0A7W1X7Y6_9BACL|nr:MULTISPECIES: hypothetical protein [Thermoactinomyces]MBA4541733.1 hypothetical protein [Thermoactinomyces daqus]MBH8597182.1 hypothetical protein [Thermoactinomyces sp. CICC 10523]MBH8602742.1 hypothetical protein [Thermoactinomyces sp. CICC 10522]MBH8606149.1 hypothetical protein [Thermoactinomyces sp. CICC 10521]
MRERETGFDRTYRIGNTTIHIVAAKQTEEEKDRRLSEIIEIIEMIWLKRALW